MSSVHRRHQIQGVDPGQSIQHKFRAISHEATKNGWKIEPKKLGKIHFISPTGMLLSTEEPTSQPELINLRNQLMKMGLQSIAGLT